MPTDPVINLDDPVENGGKIVGRRKLADAWTRGMALQKIGAQLMRSFGHRGRPKGVQRFRTFEEANEWEMKFLTARVKK